MRTRGRTGDAGARTGRRPSHEPVANEPAARCADRAADTNVWKDKR